MTKERTDSTGPAVKRGSDPSVLAALVRHERSLIVARCDVQREAQVIREKARLASAALKKAEEERLQKELIELRSEAQRSLASEREARAAEVAVDLKRLVQEAELCAPPVIAEALGLILPRPEVSS